MAKEPQVIFYVSNKFSDAQELYDAAYKLYTGKASILEKNIKVLLKPAPRWMPNRTWKWLISKFIYIEERKYGS